MEKLHERKMNDLYKSPNGKCLEKFEFVKKFELVECRISKQIHTIYTFNVHTFPLNFHYFVLSTKSNFSTSLDYLYFLCTPS